MNTTVDVKTEDGTMPLYVARPEGDPAGGIIVIQEAFGVNEHIEDVTNRFASAGYLAVAPHVFYRSGGGTVPYTDFAQAMPHFQALNDERLLMDLDATLGYLHDTNLEDAVIGIVGFCFGGRVAFLAAVNRSLGAAVTYYGGAIVTSQMANRPPLVGQAGELVTPWLGIFGDEDESISVDDVTALQSAVASAPVDTDVVRYPEAGHGFSCDARPSYHESSAKDAWQRTLDWLSKHLKR